MKITISDPRPKTEVDLQTAYQNGYNQYPIDHPIVIEYLSVSNRSVHSTITIKKFIGADYTGVGNDIVIPPLSGQNIVLASLGTDWYLWASASPNLNIGLVAFSVNPLTGGTDIQYDNGTIPNNNNNGNGVSVGSYAFNSSFFAAILFIDI